MTQPPGQPDRDRLPADPWSPALRPAPGAAVELAGRRADAASLTAGDPPRGDVSARHPVDQLAALVGAAAAHRPVLIGDPALPRPPLPDHPDVWLVAATSGSTGRPRAVGRTLASWTSSFAAYTRLTGLRPGDRLLLTGPLHSTLQLFAAVHALAAGVAVTDQPAGATAAVCVPSSLAAVVAAAPGLRRVVVAGGRLQAGQAHAAVDRGIELVEYYGAAELSFVAARRWPAPLTPFEGVELELRDGVVWSRSPYHALPLPGSGMRCDDTGLATVGDRAVLDGEGLRVLGRGATALDVGGSTVLVEDVEEAIAALPGVVEVAVGGQPHPRLGSVPVAQLVLLPGTELAAVRAAARSQLRPAWLPRRWTVVPALPRTAGGKLDRPALAERP